MEFCRCEHYRNLLDKVKFTTLATLDRESVRLQIPKGMCITWKPSQLSLADYRLRKPYVVPIGGEKEEVKDDPCKFVDSKWVPLTTDLTSLKIVNQHKPPDRPF